MNMENLNRLVTNYIDHFDYFDDPVHGYESYKWEAIGQVQSNWDLFAPDLSEMIKRSFSKTYNLINNRVEAPGNGLVLLAKEDPEKVKAAFDSLLVRMDDPDEKQEKILTFVDDMNALLDKHFPGKWKYEQDLRVVITYLSLIQPSENYFYKSTPAHDFAQIMEFPVDLGRGNQFKLRYYYQMCDELVQFIQNSPELRAIDKTRKVSWRDDSYHVLATDLIYCFAVYPFMKSGLSVPPSRKIISSKEEKERHRAERVNELQIKIDQLQDAMDNVEQELSAIPNIQLLGKKIFTKAFQDQMVTRQEEKSFFIEVMGKEREFIIPDSVVDGFVSLSEPCDQELCQKEASLNEQHNMLDQSQKRLKKELARLQ